jgi:hypothetical protein
VHMSFDERCWCVRVQKFIKTRNESENIIASHSFSPFEQNIADGEEEKDEGGPTGQD